jgi:transcriptional regulator with XRE-family HTH domain
MAGSIQSEREFMDALRALRARSGLSYRDLARRMSLVAPQHAVSKSTLASLFAQDALPRRRGQLAALVSVLVLELDEPAEETSQYLTAWSRLMTTRSATATVPAHPPHQPQKPHQPQQAAPSATTPQAAPSAAAPPATGALAGGAPATGAPTGRYRVPLYQPADNRQADYRETEHWQAESRQTQYRQADYHQAEYRQADYHQAEYWQAGSRQTQYWQPRYRAPAPAAPDPSPREYRAELVRRLLALLAGLSAIAFIFWAFLPPGGISFWLVWILFCWPAFLGALFLFGGGPGNNRDSGPELPSEYMRAEYRGRPHPRP